MYTAGYSGVATRCTGLFAEPATYSAGIFMLVAARLVGHKFRPRLIDWIGIATMVGSLALTGVGLASMLVVGMALSIPRRTVSVALATALTLGAVVVDLYGIGPLAYVIARSGRIVEGGSDGSISGRFIYAFEYVAERDQWHALLGSGLGAYSWSVGRGSGLGDLLIYLGFIGASIFIGLFAFAFYLRRVSPVAFVLWAATLAAAPLTTSPGWWLWSGMLVLLLGGHAADRGGRQNVGEEPFG